MQYEGAVLDLDGTIYRGDEPVPGAATAVERLREAGLGVLFFSNNPTKSGDAYVERLASFGIDARPSEVLSSGTVTTRYLLENHDDDAVFVVGSDGLRRQFEAADVDLVADATAADVLVVSWDRDFDYDDMLAGYRALEAGATFYGTDPDLLVPSANGLVPGSGAIVNAVGGAADAEPEAVFGKPSATARRAAFDALDAPPERCLVVGDRLDTDVALGERAGATSVLVRSGVATDADVAVSPVEPDYVLDSLADVESLLER